MQQPREIPMFWDTDFEIVFIKDGASLADKSTKSLKINISSFINKYQMDLPKFIAKLPSKFIES